MRFMTNEAWDGFGFSLVTAINTLASHRPTPQVEEAKERLMQALVGLEALGVFSEGFSSEPAHY